MDYTDYHHDSQAKAEHAAAMADAKREAMLDAQSDDAEHAVQMMLHDDPEALMAVFHDNATEADLDAMDAALIAYMKSVKDGEESALYDAVVRIVAEVKV